MEGRGLSKKKQLAAMRKKKAELATAKKALTVLLSATIAAAGADAGNARVADSADAQPFGAPQERR